MRAQACAKALIQGDSRPAAGPRIALLRLRVVKGRVEMNGLLKFAAIAGFAILTACNQVRFEAEKNAPTVPSAPALPGVTPPGACGTVDGIRRSTKLLFLVDSSGSNVEATQWPGIPGCENSLCIPPTDPAKRFRVGALSDFLNRFRHKTNFNWSLVTFAGDSARALINTGLESQPIFAADPNALDWALNRFANERDAGMTPYGAAFELARRAIQFDPARTAPEKPQYLVVLISDGFPTDYLDTRNQFNRAALDADVQNLLATAPGQVNLSTIFYGQVAIPQAISLLSDVARQGGGQFATVRDPNTFKIDDVIPGSACQ